MRSTAPANRLISKLVLRLTNYFFLLFLSIKRFISVMKVYGKPDLVYGYASSGSVAAYIAGRFCRVPNITRLYGTFLYQYLSNLPRLVFNEEFLAFKLPCKYLIITNDGTRGDVVAKTLKVPSERVRYWMNGVDSVRDSGFDPKKFKEMKKIPDNVPIIIWVGRLARWKGVDRLINAIPAIVSGNKRILALIVGDGEERRNLECLGQRLGITEHVRFVGSVSHVDVSKYMRIADIFVSLQDHSNISSSLLEAMKYGMCIVTLDSGGTNEIVKNGQNGVLIEYNALSNLSKVILNLLDNENLNKELGKKAQEFANEHFHTWNERVMMEIELIEGLFKRR
jgi:glycosyltransferase involved in cell wall biosynthesis